MKILLAVDGSHGSDAAVQQVLARPWPDGSEVKILSVVELLTTVTAENFWVPSSYYLNLEQSLQAQANAAIERAEARFQAAQSPLKVTTEILNGVAKEAIVEEADRWGADWIVVGSHGYRGLKKLWYGSVSQAVASHAHCSVEIVRAESKSNHEKQHS
ncbi:MAG: universal stress protein [Blastocatellia bacterium]|nr:universal stress protein [Blastocatellia bacterium]